MKRFRLVLLAMAAVVIGSVVGEARAEHGSSGFGGGFSDSCGPSRSYSAPAYDSYGGYGRGGYGSSGYGYGGQSWSAPSRPAWHGSTYYDYHPTQIQIQRGHISVQPGHYDRHSTRHWGW